MIAFSGVRNSCVTFVRNSDFSRFASNKSTFDCANSPTRVSSDRFVASNWSRDAFKFASIVLNVSDRC